MTGAVDLPLDLPELTYRTGSGSIVRRTVHPSGLRILTERVPGATAASVGFWIPVGSRDEADGRHGSTHFLEHLLFKGTATRSAMDIAVAFDEVGGEQNAVTAKEHTCYYAKVRDTDLPMAIEVLADMISSSLITEDDFETERGVILEELAMADDDPSDVVGERFAEAVFGSHGLGRPIAGSPETIEGVTRDAVVGHYRAHYRPQDLVVTVAGAADHDTVVALVTEALAKGGWDLTTENAPSPRRSGAAELGEFVPGLTVVDRPNEQTNLIVGGIGLAATSPRVPALTVLNSVLGRGMSSRLFQVIREQRGLAYSVYSFTPTYSDSGMIGLYAGCSPANALEVAELMLGELRSLGETPITEDELRRAAGFLGGAAVLAMEDSDTRMSRLGRAELTLGEFVDIAESTRRVLAVTRDDVQSLAADLTAGPPAIAAVGSVDEAALAALSSRASVA